MRFWDSSAVVPLLIREPFTPRIDRCYRENPQVAVWWGTELECVSAIARRERRGGLSARALESALERLDKVREAWHVIEPSGSVRNVARRLLRTHDLRAGDSLQLAAAIVASEGLAEALGLVCLDGKLIAAALREGFEVVEVG